MRAFTPGQPGPPPALTAPPLPAHVAAVLDPFEWGALAARADVVAMVVSAAGGRVEAVTPACADSWGAAPAEWQQQCLENFVHPHDWHPLRMALDRLARSSLARAAQGISSSSISGGGGDTSTGSGISSGFHVATASSSLANAAAIVPQRSEPLQPLDVAVNIATGFDRYARVVLWGRALVPRPGPDMASPDDFPALLIVAFDASDGVSPPALADQPGRFDMVVSADSTVLFVSPFVFSPLGWRPCELVNRDISTIIATNVQTVSTVLRAITATRGRADGIERSTVSVQLQHRDGLSRSAMLLIHPCPVSASSVSQYLEIIAIVLPGAATTQRVSPPTIGDLVHASPTLEPYQQQPSYQQQQPFQQQQQLQPQRAIKSEPAGAWTGDDAAIEQARRRYRPARRVTLVSNDSQRSSSSSSSSSSTPSARRVSASASTATSSSNSSSSRGRSRSGDDEQRKAAGKVVRRAASDGRAMDEPGTTEFMFKHTPHTRAYKRLPVVTDNKQCTSCGTSVTPEWRRGPEGPKTLCNACGLQYAKLAKEDPQFAAALERPASAPSDAEHRWHAQQSSSVFSRRGTSLPTFPAGPTDAFAQNPHEPLYSFDAGHAVAHFPHLYGGDTATDWASQLPAMPVPTVPVTYPWPPANDHLAHAYAHPAPPFMDPFAQPLSDAHMGSDAAISTSPGGFYREHQQHDQPPPPGRP